LLTAAIVAVMQRKSTRKLEMT